MGEQSERNGKICLGFKEIAVGEARNEMMSSYISRWTLMYLPVHPSICLLMSTSISYCPVDPQLYSLIRTSIYSHLKWGVGLYGSSRLFQLEDCLKRINGSLQLEICMQKARDKTSLI